MDLDLVMQFRNTLEQDFRHKKQVGYYCSAVVVTEKRLNQATSAVLGKSPKQLIVDRVMLEAKRLLLAHSGQRVKEIGCSLGFGEPTNFIKYFSIQSGITPAAFREK